MKEPKYFVSFAVTILVAFLISPAQTFAVDGDKYAFVDVAKVFDDFQKTKDNDRILQEEGKKKEQERDVIVHEIRQMKDELSLVTSEARAKKQESLELKVRELQEFDQKAKQDLGQKRAGIVKEIFKDIDDTVKRYGERKGMDLIFNEKVLLYHSPRQDATAEILIELNQAYAKKKK